MAVVRGAYAYWLLGPDQDPANSGQLFKPESPMLSVLDMAELKSLESVRRGQNFRMTVERGAYVNWLLGPDQDPANSGQPEDTWFMEVAKKRLLHRLGYRPGGPLMDPPNFEIVIREPTKLYAAPLNFKPEAPMLSVFDMAELKSLESVRRGQNFRITLERGAYVDWLLGPDQDPANSGQPDDTWCMEVAKKRLLHRLGYRPGGPLMDPPNFEIVIREPPELYAAPLNFKPEPPKLSVLDLAELRSLDSVQRGQSFRMTVERGAYADWLLGPDQDPANSGQPKDTWWREVTKKRLLRRLGYRPGGPLKDPPNFEIVIRN